MTNRFINIIFLLSVSVYAISQSAYSNKDLKEGKFIDDTSFIYSLPFEEGKSFFLVQGYETNFSHKNLKALDFKMKKGSKICAARGGVVSSVEEGYSKGGLKNEYLVLGNYISIKHDDGSIANYWHLKKDGALVNIGDTVKQGQTIGLSGNTGYSAFPHLHFEVVGYNDAGVYGQLPTRFQTKKGVQYLRPGKFYRKYDSIKNG